MMQTENPTMVSARKALTRPIDDGPPPLVIYHANCADGFTAAWVIRRAMDTAGLRCEFRAAQYGDPTPLGMLDRDVLLVDFSYKRAALVELSNRARTLHVLDHHKTAQADLEGLVGCHFDMERSGARLALDAFWPLLAADEIEKIGTLVAYAEDRDLWRWQLPHSKEINALIGAAPKMFEDWDALAHELTEYNARAIAMGRAVLNAVDRYVETVTKSVRMVEIELPKGGRVTIPIVNTTHAISETVGALAEGRPFAAGWFMRDDAKVVVSLRSRGDDGADVSEIASALGGGGHRNAAGFTLSLEAFLAWADLS